ncbi:hypothetical protein [Corallococcus aberystwythensis]|uniref:Uncharacterized protein n=1 Tax=Corallococcus aberystwythensis TaxID=2316722 RepID=A0A3A8PKN5_9BACT|nr:hypothetical protein [Corallococcus aberystwythensis]RKH53072.1 hypothetical protein D7W81_39475 [Corallococcus aberystwythensis]
MNGFKRVLGLGLLVGGAMGGWGCNSEQSSAGPQGFQDPVQLQHRSQPKPAGEAAGSNLGHPSNEEGGGRPYNSDSRSSLGGGTSAPNQMEGESSPSSGRQTGGSAELGTGLADSYQGAAPSEGTGGSGRDAGTGAMDAGTGKLDAGMR